LLEIADRFAGWGQGWIRQPLQVPAFAKPLADVLLDVEIAVVDRRELVAQGWQILDGFEIQFFP